MLFVVFQRLWTLFLNFHNTLHNIGSHATWVSYCKFLLII